MIDFRTSILPSFSAPNWQEGYLSCTVPVRELIEVDIKRVVQLPEIRLKLDEIVQSTNDPVVVECVVRIAGGPDSATGFSHYNQVGILGTDDSLLSENYMCLQLLTVTGEKINVKVNSFSCYLTV